MSNAELVEIEKSKTRQLEAKAQIQIAKANGEIAKARSELAKSFRNSGYSESGASRVKKSMKGWTANSKSPKEDIDENLDILRQRSRDLFMSAPIATSAIKTNRTNVVGQGLKLKARIDFSFLGLSKEEADAWEMNTEREFNLWADSVWCDALRINNFNELQQLAFMSWLLNGDGFGLLKSDVATDWMPYTLRMHLFEADRVSNPDNKTGNDVKAPNGNRIINGIEVNCNGAVEAYWVCNQYPSSNTWKKEWTRVEAFGKKTGNPNILHLMEQERCEQYRGVPYLAPVIESLKQINRYSEATLTAAVVQSFFTAFIKTQADTSDNPFNSAIPEELQVENDDISYELGAGTINVLRPGEDVSFGDPKQPTAQFEVFTTAMCKYIGAALEIPFELLTKSFMASYSASRAALLEAWKAFRMRRTWFAADFCQPTYEVWLSEAVAQGRVIAPGYFNDIAIKKAWCKADWNGPAPGQIDPVKEVAAATARVAEGYSTHEQETIGLTGGDWDKNIIQITRENELLRKARGATQPITEGGND